MLDKKHLIIKAGDGGNGRVYFRREKYVPKGGPSGGRGGNGGSVVIRATKHLNTLKHLAGKTKFEAQRGQDGMRQKKTGAKGEDLVIQVPLGTEVRVLAQNQTANKRLPPSQAEALSLRLPLKRKQVRFQTYQLEKEGEAVPQREVDNKLVKLSSPLVVAQLSTDGQEVVIAQGGFGGRGNESFKSSTLTTPLVAEYGTFGEAREVELELKLLADVGLVGFPSVGKSTLLSVLTSARPKVANYPFTTLEPNLGIASYDDKEVVIADLPGIIEGAHQGKGLGDRFLKHIEHTRVLVYVLALPDEIAADSQVETKIKLNLLNKQLRTLMTEAKSYNPALLKKQSLVVVNKVDLLKKSELKQLELKLNQALFVSAKTKVGIEKLKQRLVQVVSS